MPPAFFIAEVEVIDPEEFKLYASRVAETAARYGGRYIVRGGKTESARRRPAETHRHIDLEEHGGRKTVLSVS